VTASEFAFLAMGLILGIAAGAALIEVVRARPTAPREVRVTMTADAIPRRRAATLANDAFTEARMASEPARGGPADRGDLHAGDADRSTEPRTPVHVPRPGTIVEPAFRLTGPMPSSPVLGGDGRGPAGSLSMGAGATAMPVSSGVDPMLTALRASAAASAEAAMRSSATSTASATAGATATGTAMGPATAGATAAETTTAIAVAEGDRPSPTAGDTPGRALSEQSRSKTGSSRTSRTATSASPAAPRSPGTPGAPGGDDGGPCAEARRIADERCELATRARAQATDAEGTHWAAQREYDDHETAAAEAAAEADPRAVRQRKDEAQAKFRDGRAAATTNQEVDAAARAWLLEINEINSRAARAATTLAKAHASAPDFAVRLERTAVAADAARISAEAAEATCVAARQAVAYCEEQASLGTLGILPQMPPPSGGDGETVSESHALAAAMRSGASPRIVRLLRGDRAAMQELVAAIAGDSADDRRHWQSALSDLVDAILADSIAASALEFPQEHPFWGPFTRAQSRDIAGALASLGYRFDGIGGWADDHVPSQRDLSLALGYAGLDPMRMRHWPSEEEMETLFSEVQVAAAEHLAGAAGDLTLGELVSMLGRRADGLTEVWNSWGRIRPLMLDET
jgi:hypothetical protein